MCGIAVQVGFQLPDERVTFTKAPSTGLGTQKLCLPASGSPTEFSELKETIPCMTVARDCANCEFRAVECACDDNPKL